MGRGVVGGWGWVSRGVVGGWGGVSRWVVEGWGWVSRGWWKGGVGWGEWVKMSGEYYFLFFFSIYQRFYSIFVVFFY